MITACFFRLGAAFKSWQREPLQKKDVANWIRGILFDNADCKRNMSTEHAYSVVTSVSPVINFSMAVVKRSFVPPLIINTQYEMSVSAS